MSSYFHGQKFKIPFKFLRIKKKITFGYTYRYLGTAKVLRDICKLILYSFSLFK